VQLLKETSSGTERVAVMFNPDSAPYTIFLPVMETVAPQVGVTLIRAPVRDTVAIESAISKLASVPGGGLVVLPDIFMALNRELILRLAARSRLPTMGPLRFYAVDGGLMSYGSNFPDLFRQAAAYVDRILHGEKPSDLPVQAPTKFELVINLKTAQALGIEVPPGVLSIADEVIE
jgi:putative ABC transport system substrate-binding protein